MCIVCSLVECVENVLKWRVICLLVGVMSNACWSFQALRHAEIL